MARPEHFPPTQRTWLHERLALGDLGREEALRLVMAVYAEPLKIYFRGTSWSSTMDADEVVHGFLVDRLSRQDYLDEWASSGLRLRRWLMNGLCFYARETLRRTRRDAAADLDGLDEDVRSPGAAQSIDRAFARALVRRALAEAQSSCEASGLGLNWTLFFEHHMGGRTCRELAEDHGLTEDEAWGRIRTATRRFVKALRRLIERDGTDPSRVDDEIRSLMASAGE